MQSWILELKSVVLVILVSEFLKELLTGDKFKKYIQFAITLFLFAFLLTGFLHTDFSLPPLPEDFAEGTHQSLLQEEFAVKIQEQIAKKLSEHQLSYEKISVVLSKAYEIETIRIETTEPPEKIHALLKGEFPYEVVFPPEG